MLPLLPAAGLPPASRGVAGRPFWVVTMIFSLSRSISSMFFCSVVQKPLLDSVVILEDEPLLAAALLPPTLARPELTSISVLVTRLMLT